MRQKIFKQKLMINITSKQHRFLQKQSIIKGKTVSEIVRDLIDKERTKGQ